MENKYMLMGVAGFLNENDMKKLAKQKNNGFEITDTVGNILYKLKKCEPKQDVVYVAVSEEKIDEEYREMLKESGWKVLLNKQGLQILEGTSQSIELDTDVTLQKKYLFERMKKNIIPVIVSVLGIEACIHIFKTTEAFNNIYGAIITALIICVILPLAILPFVGDVYQYIKLSMKK